MARPFGALGIILWVLAAPAAALAGEGTTCLLQSSVGMQLSHEAQSRYEPSSDSEPAAGLLYQPASTPQFVAAVEAENKAIAYLQSLLQAELNFTRPMRLAKMKKLKLAKVNLARNPLKTENRSRMPKQDNRSVEEAMGEAMKVIVEAGKTARADAKMAKAHTKSETGKHGYETTKTAFVVDGLMGLAALFMPTGTCLFPMIIMWWLLGVLALHYDQDISLADAILMLTQMATTVGYGTQTPSTPIMRAFHGFHGWLVGQGIDTAMDTMADVPLDFWDNRVMAKLIPLTPGPPLRSELAQSVQIKAMDLLFNLVVTTVYFVFDFKQGWYNDDGSKMFKKMNEAIGPAIYTAIISMTSIGYGDFYPNTTWGKTASAGVLSALTQTFERYSNALGEWNDLGKFREHKRPGPGFPQDQPAWHFGNCPAVIKEGDPNWFRRYFVKKEDYTTPVEASVQADDESPEMRDTGVGPESLLSKMPYDDDMETLSSGPDTDLRDVLPPMPDDDDDDDADDDSQDDDAIPDGPSMPDMPGADEDTPED